MSFNFNAYSQPSQPAAVTAPPLHECLAKTRLAPDGSQVFGCTVEAHLQAVCLTIRELRNIFAGTPVYALLPPIVEWLSALHDIGKMTPVFQQKIYAALKIKKDFGISFPLEKENHGLSTLLVLRQRFGEQFAKIASAHHGFGFLSPSYHTEQAEWLGGPEWEKLRKRLIENLKYRLGLPDYNAGEIVEENISAMLGAVILADWLGSSMDIPYGIEPNETWAAKTVADAGFKPCDILQNLCFEDIFPFAPNPLQSLLLQEIHPGGCYVIEAEMGSGKTEAALYLAYKCLENKKATGIYFALPTQLTSEKIHARLDDFLNKVITDSSRREALLIHGEAWLNWNIFQENDDGVACLKPNSWFYAPKRALLAPFAVGTIDQALMAVINVKHRDLRAFALAGKVVIIDEVHSYDTYTGTLINELIRRLKNWGCTIIVLSATLTDASKKKLMGATTEPNLTEDTPAYPLVSIQRPNSPLLTVMPPPTCRKSVTLAHSTDEMECVKEALCAADTGQQVLWIENTVNNAQRLFQTLSAASLGTAIEVGLIHSRFPQFIRSENESRWVALYGKNGSDQRQHHGRILIGTQILEQSLDIDADLLITRLAPSDMLLQRIGRLWRHHPSLPRPKDATCKAIILHSALYDQLTDLYASRKDDLPYERYVMARTQEIWQSKQSIKIPEDIRSIMEATYAERIEEAALARLKAELNDRVRSMHQQAIVNASSTLNVIDDDAAQTRLNDLPQVQLLLIAKNNRGDDLSQRIWTPFSDEPIPVPPSQAAPAKKKAALKKLGSVMIKTNESYAPSYEGFTLEEALGNLMYLGNSDFRPVRAAFLDLSGFLLDKAANYAGNTGERLHYSRNLGLQKIKDDTTHE